MPGQDIQALKLVAREIQSNLQKYAPARKGGNENLRKQLAATNSLNSIIKKTKIDYNVELKSQDVGTISIDVAPNRAKYGEFWNEPNVSWQVRAQKTGNLDKIDFGQRSIDDAILKYIDLFADEIAENMAQSVADKWWSAGSESGKIPNSK